MLLLATITIKINGSDSVCIYYLGVYEYVYSLTKYQIILFLEQLHETI